jgi:capsular exopolysaccharide synthesis family protein
MSRIDQALKRRQREKGQGGGEAESPIVAAWQLERFPNETAQEPEKPHFDVEIAPQAVPSVEPPSRFEPQTEPPPMAVFRGFSHTIEQKVVAGGSMHPESLEQYRRLAAALHHTQVERGIKKVMVASAVAGEGKTLTALNLALTLSESYRRRVLLIDADLRRPKLHDLLGVPNTIGLNEALKDTSEARLTLLQVSPRLSVLPTGRPDPDPMSALTSRRMALVLEEGSENFDWVIIDTPPVVMLPDTNLLAAMVDVAILVVEAGRTPYDMSDRAIQALGRERVLGVVLNGVKQDDGYREYSSYRQ